MNFTLIQNRRIWLTFSGILVITSIVLFGVWGLNLGIDFTGGSLLEISYEESRPSAEEIGESVRALDVGDVRVQLTGDDGAIIRLNNITEEKHQEILAALAHTAGENGLIEERFESIGPAIGEELKRKAFWAMLTVLIAIICYVTWAFRKVSKPIVSWKYGAVTVLTLFHDVLIVVGVFVLLGKFAAVEVNTAFIAALLTILGYSVNDTIVVFDRIRENLHKHFLEDKEGFEGLVNVSVNQTIMRSLNTSFTTLFVLLAVFFLGGATVHYFILALVVGVLVGTYSSIFVASPLLVQWEKMKK